MDHSTCASSALWCPRTDLLFDVPGMHVLTIDRQVDANENAVVLSGSDDVPQEFRKLVEEYYKSLSKGTK